MKRRIASLTALLALAAGAHLRAAEERVWTSRKGEDVTAQLLRVEGGEAILVTPEPREIEIPIEDLSLVDRQYLVEYGGADPKVITGSKLGVPEKEARDMTKDFKRLEEKLVLGDSEELVFDLLETPHFLVASVGKIRPTDTGEMAERLWRGMAFQHINFREDWGNKRKLIFLVENEDVHAALGNYYSDFLKGKKGEHMQDVAARTRVLWDQVSSTSMYLPEDVVKKYTLFDDAKVFKIGNISKSYEQVFGPFPTHSLASALLGQQMGGIADYADEGRFAITVGHAYFKEIQLAERTETQLIDADLYDNDDIVKAKGFEDGTSWADSLRKLVRKGKVEPDMEKMFSWEQKDLTPERLVLIYSFGYYLQSTPERMNAFANMVRRIQYDGAMPLRIEMAKLFGFKTEEEFQKDWIEFIKSQDFK